MAKKKKTFDKLLSPMPNIFIRNGAAAQLSKNEWLIYHILSMHQNYNTHVAHVNFNLIRSYKNLSGTTITNALKHLANLNIIQILDITYFNQYGRTKKNAYLLLGF